MTEPVYIDGSQGEGGGQILRTSLALASLLSLPIRIDSIRANRKKPGLKTQHLAGVLALAKITDAEVQGAHLHSTDLVFKPRCLRGGKCRFDISTAGAATMLFSGVLPPLIFAEQPSEVIITGGTHVPFSPPFHYLERVFLPALRKLGPEVTVELRRWGFYPNGGGEIRAHVRPCRDLQGVWLEERGTLQRLRFSAGTANLPEHITRREAAHAERRLADYAARLETDVFACRSAGPGNVVFLEARYRNTAAGFSSLGRRGRPAEDVAEEVCRDFLYFDNTVATADSHLADQLVPYMALARGESRLICEKMTGHLVTNIAVIRRFLPVAIDLDRTSGLLTVAGCSFSR